MTSRRLRKHDLSERQAFFDQTWKLNDIAM
jgi:hypothetical protein